MLNQYGNTPLHLAAYMGHTATVAELLDRGADVNAVNKYNNTPLHLAIDKGHTEAEELLSGRGADMFLTRFKNSRETEAGFSR